MADPVDATAAPMPAPQPPTPMATPRALAPDISATFEVETTSSSAPPPVWFFTVVCSTSLLNSMLLVWFMGTIPLNAAARAVPVGTVLLHAILVCIWLVVRGAEPNRPLPPTAPARLLTCILAVDVLAAFWALASFVYDASPMSTMAGVAIAGSLTTSCSMISGHILHRANWAHSSVPFAAGWYTVSRSVGEALGCAAAVTSYCYVASSTVPMPDVRDETRQAAERHVLLVLYAVAFAAYTTSLTITALCMWSCTGDAGRSTFYSDRPASESVRTVRASSDRAALGRSPAFVRAALNGRVTWVSVHDAFLRVVGRLLLDTLLWMSYRAAVDCMPVDAPIEQSGCGVSDPAATTGPWNGAGTICARNGVAQLVVLCVLRAVLGVGLSSMACRSKLNMAWSLSVACLLPVVLQLPFLGLAPASSQPMSVNSIAWTLVAALSLLPLVRGVTLTSSMIEQTLLHEARCEDAPSYLSAPHDSADSAIDVVFVLCIANGRREAIVMITVALACCAILSAVRLSVAVRDWNHVLVRATDQEQEEVGEEEKAGDVTPPPWPYRSYLEWADVSRWWPASPPHSRSCLCGCLCSSHSLCWLCDTTQPHNYQVLGGVDRAIMSGGEIARPPSADPPLARAQTDATLALH